MANTTRSVASPRILWLPAEVCLTICEFVADVGALMGLKQTCRAFRCALEDPTGQQTITSITTHVVNNMFRTMPEAFAVWEGKHGQILKLDSDEDWLELREFLCMIGERRIPTRQWTIKDAESMNQTHIAVRHFAKDYLQVAWDKFHGDTVTNRRPSSQEITRFERIFYFFEFCCDLHRATNDAFMNEYRYAYYPVISFTQSFMHQYPCWKQEALAGCMQYLLEKSISSTIVHGILAAERKQQTDFDPSAASSWNWQYSVQRYLLSLGLHNFRRLTLTEEATVAEFSQPGVKVPRLASFLETDLSELNYYILEDARVMDVAHASRPAGARFLEMQYDPDDDDSGPEDAYLRCHDMDTGRRGGTVLAPEFCKKISDWFVRTPHHHGLRGCGYVMWDKATLDAAGFFDTPWPKFQAEKTGEEEAQPHKFANVQEKGRIRYLDETGSVVSETDSEWDEDESLDKEDGAGEDHD